MGAFSVAQEKRNAEYRWALTKELSLCLYLWPLGVYVWNLLSMNFFYKSPHDPLNDRLSTVQQLLVIKPRSDETAQFFDQGKRVMHVKNGEKNLNENERLMHVQHVLR